MKMTTKCHEVIEIRFHLNGKQQCVDDEGGGGEYNRDDLVENVTSFFGETNGVQLFSFFFFMGNVFSFNNGKCDILWTKAMEIRAFQIPF